MDKGTMKVSHTAITIHNISGGHDAKQSMEFDWCSQTLQVAVGTIRWDAIKKETTRHDDRVDGCEAIGNLINGVVHFRWVA